MSRHVAIVSKEDANVWPIECDRPVFRLILPCKFGCCGEKWNATQDLYGQTVIQYELVTFGEFLLYVVVCGHRNFGPSRDDVVELIEEYYGPVHAIRMYEPGKTAFTYPIGRKYVWSLCERCGRESVGDSHYFGIVKRLPRRYRTGSHLSCSVECDLLLRGFTCCVCGRVAALRDDDDDHSTCLHSELFYESVKSLALSNDCFVRFGSLFCSVECCSLAVDRVLRIERENAKIQGELKCVRDVRKLLHKARKEFAKGIPSREALHTLKQEFERAESLQE